MATSGEVKTNEEYGSHFWVKWEQDGDQDIANNRTKIKWSCGVYCGHSFGNIAIKMYAVTINGTKVYSGGTYSYFDKGNHTLSSGTMWITHNSDGKKTFSISSFGGWLYSNHNYSSNGDNYSLTDISRKATITSASSFTSSGTLPTVNYSNPAGNSVAELVICIADNRAWEAVDYRSVSKTGTSYTFTKDDIETLKSKVETATDELEVTFVLRTKIGETLYYSSSDVVTFTLVEDDTTKPSVSMNVSLNNGSLPSAFDGLYIQGKSRLDVSLSAIGKYGATIKSYSAKIDGKTYNSDSFITDVITSSSDVDVLGYAKDSRGFTGSASSKVNVIPYSKPLVVPIGLDNAIFCYRSDGNGVRVGNSTSVWIKAKKTFYSVSGKNSCALQWRRKLITEEWNDKIHLWNDLITTADEYNALLSGEVFEKKESYTVQIRAIDDIGEYDLKTFEIPTEDVALHLGKGGKNVAVGTYCNGLPDYRFYSDWEGQFDKGLWGSSLNFNVTDVLQFPEECADGITPIIINDSTNKDNLPEGNYAYSVGIIHKRTADQYNVILMDYVAGKIAINVHLSGTWTGWKYITPQ
jgi:hypothetical protein